MRSVWIDLAKNMRRLRQAANLSLRQTAARSSWTRGYLSQVETGYARPSRELVQWYDDNLEGDGLLLSLFNEARSAVSATGNRRQDATATPEQSRSTAEPYEIVETDFAMGLLTTPGTTATLVWKLRTPSGSWAGRSVQRVGAHTGSALLSSARSVAITATDAESDAIVSIEVTTPLYDGTVAGYWAVYDDQQRRISGPLLTAVLVVNAAGAAVQ